MTDYEQFVSLSTENLRDTRRFEVFLQVGEEICGEMLRQRMTKKMLAERLDRTQGFVTQVLSGERNMTLKTMADMATALGCRVLVKFVSTEVHHG